MILVLGELLYNKRVGGVLLNQGSYFVVQGGFDATLDLWDNGVNLALVVGNAIIFDMFGMVPVEEPID